MVAIHYLLHRDTLFLCPDSDGHSMLVGTSDEDDVLVFQSKVADVYVCRHIDTGEVTDMHTAVSVWQCGCHGRSFVLFLFHFGVYFSECLQKYKIIVILSQNHLTIKIVILYF